MSENGLVDFFYKRVISNHKWTDIPDKWKDEVLNKLISNGYILNEDGTIELK